MDKGLKEYHSIIIDSWQMLKRFITTGDPDTDTYWNDVIAEASRIGEGYNTEFARKMVSVVIGELERVWREGHEQ